MPAVATQPNANQYRNRVRQILQPLTSFVIRVYDDAANVIETREHTGEFKEW